MLSQVGVEPIAFALFGRSQGAHPGAQVLLVLRSRAQREALPGSSNDVVPDKIRVLESGNKGAPLPCPCARDESRVGQNVSTVKDAWRRCERWWKRHTHRLERASQRFPAGIVNHLRRNPRGEDQGFPEFEGEILDVLGIRRHLQDLDCARGAAGGNPRRRF